MTTTTKSKSRRRANHEGGLRLRRDGRWEFSYYDAGKRHTGYASTKEKAAARLRESLHDRDHGREPVDGRRTTEAFLEGWLADSLPSAVKAGTVENYANVLRRYVVPHIGRVPLAKLGPQHVQAMMAALEDQGLSPNTRRLARSVLRRALGQALRWGLTSRNAAALVDAPKGAGVARHDELDAAGAQAVLDAARGHRLEAFAVVALHYGLRRGELLGLRWDDLDFDAGTLTVARSLSYRSGVGLVIDTPKRESAGTIPLVAPVGPALREHRRRQLEERLALGAAWTDSGYVFTTETGGPLDPRNILRWWHKLTEGAGVGRRRIHAARHTAGTLLLERGVPLEVVSAILRHASVAITADVYARVGMDAKRRALATLADAFGTA